MQAAEAARHAASFQGPAGGVAGGAIPPAQRGPDHPPAPTGEPTPAGWNAQLSNHGSGADADADDYDPHLQAALAASVTEQLVNRAVDLTRLAGVKPGERVSSRPMNALYTHIVLCHTD